MSQLARTGALCCALVALCSPQRVRAQEPSVVQCVDRLTDAEVDQLLRFTQQSLADQRLGAALWFGGWSAFNAVNVSLGAWKIATADRIERDTWLMSTIGAGGFLLNASILPLPALYAHRRMVRLPARTPDERRQKLRRGLELLEDAADAETRNSNLLAHLGGAFFGLFSAGYIWLHNRHGDGHTVALAAGLQLGSTIVGAEATLWSVPRRARRDLKQLQSGACADPVPRVAEQRRPTFNISIAPHFVGLGLRF